MAIKRSLSIGDWAHRGLVFTLVGVSVWGLLMIGVVHKDTLRRGRGASITILILYLRLIGFFSSNFVRG